MLNVCCLLKHTHLHYLLVYVLLLHLLFEFDLEYKGDTQTPHPI